MENPPHYHLLKTHKIPTDIVDPSTWLDEQGFPVRGIRQKDLLAL